MTLPLPRSRFSAAKAESGGATVNGCGDQNCSTLDTVYAIKGFRSLIDFELALRPGVNVLVGPNGSGKTNFIDFLDFLDNLIRWGASASVSSAGGVARVFSVENIKQASPSLCARVSSLAEVLDRDLEAVGVFNFVYEIDIKFSKADTAIYISREMVKVWKLRNSDDGLRTKSALGSFSITRRSASFDEAPIFQISPRLLARTELNPLSIAPRFRATKTWNPAEELDDYALNLEPDESFLTSRPMMPAVEAVRLAVTRGRSFNIIPSCARAPDDLTRQPVIQRDGSGLSATLHYLKLAAKGTGRRRRALLSRKINPSSFGMALEWTKLVFPDLVDISVTQDPHTGKYLVHLIVGDKPLKIPLAAASDGTIKWLAFVCLMVTSRSASSIEEPENFLHPKMQQFLVDIIRDTVGDSRPGYFLISTHSETLVNQCKPEELIIFELDGGTRCRRIEDSRAVMDEINETGFGLGYYYANNALP
jgi:predicted ATPase